MGEPTFVNVLVKTEPNYPTPSRGTGTVGIFGFSHRVQDGYIGEEILISTTGTLTITSATDDCTRSQGSWLIDGVSVGDKFTFSGTSTTDGTYTVIDVTTDTVTFDEDIASDDTADQDELRVFAYSSTYDELDPPEAGEVKKFTNLFDIQQRYGATSAIARSAAEAIQNNVAMPLVLMPIQASDTTYGRDSGGEEYSSGDTEITLTEYPTLPLTIYEGNTPLVEGYDSNSADYWVDVSNKKVYFYEKRPSGGTVYYDTIQSGDITSHISNLEPRVINIAVCAYSMGQSTLQDEVFDHVLSTSSSTKPRLGIVSNEKDSNSTSLTTTYANDRMIVIAHQSKRDINVMAAAVLSRLQPQESLLLKSVVGDMSTGNFTDSDYNDTFIDNQIVSLVNSEFITGEQYRFTESFTLSSDSFKKYIDAMRVIDDVSFKIRATLTNPSLLGTVKLATPQGMSRLRTTVVRFMNTLRDVGEIDDYSVLIPGEEIVNKPRNQRTAEEDATLKAMVAERKFKVLVDIIYTGAVHYLDPVELRFSNA